MLIQILRHTPLFVWAILAFLIYRGVVALRTREVAAWKLFIMPFVMVALALQDIVTTFDAAFLAVSAWASAALVATLLVAKFSRSDISAGAAPGSARIAGSAVPLAMMMTVFFTKYAASLLLAVQPQALQQPLLPLAVCSLLGMSNGYFLGQLARTVPFWHGPHGTSDRVTPG